LTPQEAESLDRTERQKDQMNLKILLDTPPWDWPNDAGKTFQEILIDSKASESDRLVAAELAGDFTVINDELADALMAVVCNAGQPEQLRARAAISLGPVLEHADTEGFEDPDDAPITEPMFWKIQESLHRLYLDDSVPKEVRRRILEASVRAPQNWHKDAIRDAYSSEDKDLVLTAVFSMRWVRGFDNQILKALKSAYVEIQYEAVNAAGNWELDAAWSHILALVNNAETAKPLLLAAISAAASIRPQEAGAALIDLAASDDEEIAEAVEEAIAMSGEGSDEAGYDETDASEWIN
jgi:hypothetical protein